MQNNIAEGAAKMTDTKFSSKVLGSAWPRHFNKSNCRDPCMKNIKEVGLPTWSENDQKLARAVQKVVKSSNQNGLATKLSKIGIPQKTLVSGGSDDIGDIFLESTNSNSQISFKYSRSSRASLVKCNYNGNPYCS